MLRTLPKRVRAAVTAFRNPGPSVGEQAADRLTANITVDEDAMRDIVERTLADAFRQFDAPDVDHRTEGHLHPEIVEQFTDAVRDEIYPVDEDALVSRIVVDAVNEVTVYWDETKQVEDGAAEA